MLVRIIQTTDSGTVAAIECHGRTFALRKMESLSLSSKERWGLIEKGGLSDPLFTRTLDTSADLISLTKIGLGRWEEESNFPKRNESLTDSDWTDGVMLERTETAFSRSNCRRSDLEIPFLHSSTPKQDHIVLSIKVGQ